MYYMQRRYIHATPFQRFRMDLRYFLRRNLKPALNFVGEGIMGIVWILTMMFGLPIIAALFH